MRGKVAKRLRYHALTATVHAAAYGNVSVPKDKATLDLVVRRVYRQLKRKYMEYRKHGN